MELVKQLDQDVVNLAKLRVEVKLVSLVNQESSDNTNFNQIHGIDTLKKLGCPFLLNRRLQNNKTK